LLTEAILYALLFVITWIALIIAQEGPELVEGKLQTIRGFSLKLR